MGGTENILATAAYMYSVYIRKRNIIYLITH